MKDITKALAAFNIGIYLKSPFWKIWRHNYSGIREDLHGNFRTLSFEVQLPTTNEDFEKEADGILASLDDHLKEERTQLGGDVFALTLFYLSHFAQLAIVKSAFDEDDTEMYLTILKAVLSDLGIAGWDETFKNAFDLESKWLKEEAHREGSFIIEDALKVVRRLWDRVFRLWAEAENSDIPIPFDHIFYNSVFISYSTSDEIFCKKLFNTLKEHGVQVWFAPHSMKPGEKIHNQIYEAIGKYDKLLLVLSDNSMNSEWVKTELYNARQLEVEKGKRILFPIRLASLESIKKWKAFDSDSGKDMAREIREYFIPDFQNWENSEAYNDGIDRIIEALKQERMGAAHSTNK